ncbi:MULTISPECIES: ECF transporter S component [unclassified Fusibacter]|uniref:ECF transporter S component n=1 Tax=unclassified Fusibacter TaxID=2624464 RepID=UPI0010115DA5|nr:MULTISPECIES: ECF transporter S component [unclassified Fusibacter]MCK8060702.1 ECF transporter S component [Fusibacter sp. A2]NPE22844.1 ECF transporter S component [Fusibacter sp. A1]RXV59913.1 ECF transporter S component [Fusibacter sp. A1]
MKLNTKQLALAGIFAALVFVATWLIGFPIPAGSGYMHLGDTMVYISGALLGPLGALAAGIGSFLADFAAGYASYALPTFIIKSLDALVVAIIVGKTVKVDDMIWMRIIKFIIATVFGGLVMVSGYFAFEWFVYPEYAVIDIIPNIIQATGGILLATPLYAALSKLNLK